jgi:NADP-dependent 3-hydroxy acid dehydrogenase YdfG
MKEANVKVVFITSATSGIGRATALMLVQQGHRVIVSVRNPEVIQKTSQEFAD